MFRKLIGWVIASFFSISLALGLFAAAWMWWSINRTIDPGSEPIRVATGSTLKNVGETLIDRDQLSETVSLRLWGRLTGKGRQIKAGTYTFDKPLSVAALLDRLVAGEVLSHNIVFVEGWRFREWRDALAKASGLEQTLAGQSNEDVMRAIGADGIHPEGRFFPDTYSYTESSTDVELLKRAYERMRQVLDETWATRAQGLPLDSADDALILASIVEKETGAAEERARIAGVFVNRLRKKMRLQTDPTVIYGLGEAFDGNLTRKHLRTDGPYNTYTRAGLTPTPIAMPGADAIRAAVQPETTDAIFFVSRGDGTHKFSVTLDEHNAAVRKYQLKKGGN